MFYPCRYRKRTQTGANHQRRSIHCRRLPLTWVSEQKAAFKKYLLQNSAVCFTFRNIDYHIQIVGAEVYPQGFAAIAEKLGDFKGVNMLCDIGNGTMNLLRIVNNKPDAQRMFTEKYGTHQCALQIREQMMKLHHASLDDAIITEILKKGTADIDSKYLDTVIKTAKEYTAFFILYILARRSDSFPTA